MRSARRASKRLGRSVGAADGWVFLRPKSARLRRSGFRTDLEPGPYGGRPSRSHFHDLRHVGNTLPAANGAGLKDLMARMGHSSTQATLIYLHATQDRDQAIAEALGQAFATATGTRIEN